MLCLKLDFVSYCVLLRKNTQSGTNLLVVVKRFTNLLLHIVIHTVDYQFASVKWEERMLSSEQGMFCNNV